MPRFEAEYINGDFYIQTQDDKSTHTEGKNSFYDVLQRLDEVKRFHIIKDDNTRHTVDLESGSFGINGVFFSIYEEGKQPVIKKRKLIYFESKQQDLYQVVEMQADGSVKTKETRLAEPIHTGWLLGWESVGSPKIKKVISIGR